MNLYEAVLTDADEKYAPPQSPVLRLSVVADTAYLEIATVQETNDSATYTRIASISVDAVQLHNLLALHRDSIQDAAIAKATGE